MAKKLVRADRWQLRVEIHISSIFLEMSKSKSYHRLWVMVGSWDVQGCSGRVGPETWVASGYFMCLWQRHWTFLCNVLKRSGSTHLASFPAPPLDSTHVYGAIPWHHSPDTYCSGCWPRESDYNLLSLKERSCGESVFLTLGWSNLTYFHVLARSHVGHIQKTEEHMPLRKQTFPLPKTNPNLFQFLGLIACFAVVPLPTFILGPTSTEHAQFYKDLSADGGEMCPNLTCLGKLLGMRPL
jgi:hypothetical protein